jgi:hypothetical protein
VDKTRLLTLFPKFTPALLMLSNETSYPRASLSSSRSDTSKGTSTLKEHTIIECLPTFKNKTREKIECTLLLNTIACIKIDYTLSFTCHTIHKPPHHLPLQPSLPHYTTFYYSNFHKDFNSRTYFNTKNKAIKNTKIQQCPTANLPWTGPPPKTMA